CTWTDTPRFFYSSRRRHTRFSRDWSSDVCSSDLHERVDDERHWKQAERVCHRSRFGLAQHPTLHHRIELDPPRVDLGTPAQPYRSEERRVGKEGISWWSPERCRHSCL